MCFHINKAYKFSYYHYMMPYREDLAQSKLWATSIRDIFNTNKKFLSFIGEPGYLSAGNLLLTSQDTKI
jgi:hypothetical protein